MIETKDNNLSIKDQCELLSVSRSGYYYQPARESEENLLLMRLLDEQYLRHPYYGVERMCAWLNHDCSLSFTVNVKRVRRLLRKMGLMAVYPGQNLSKAHSEHSKYPYLLRDITINRPNQVWATDITYVPMEKGFMYLMAIMDLYSRKVLNWQIANTMEAEWCAMVLEEALQSWGSPAIFNTDQGSQFTSKVFLSGLKKKKIEISMDGKGRATDNAFIERLWRTVKYEYIYLQALPDSGSLYRGLQEWFRFYNEERRHSKLNWTQPSQLYKNYAQN